MLRLPGLPQPSVRIKDPDENSTSRNRFSARWYSIDEPPEYITLAKDWLGACEQLHGNTCTPHTEGTDPKRPRWVIDINQQCIVPGSQANRYMALSYTWAEDGNRPKATPLLLNSSNLSAFRQPGFFGRDEVSSQIPFVIQHARRVAAWLGERYLWVDRVCIVQDDNDTLSQVSRMDHVYAGAYLTIIAAAPSCMYRRAMVPDWTPCVPPRTFTQMEDSDLSIGSRTELLECRYCADQYAYEYEDESDDSCSDYSEQEDIERDYIQQWNSHLGQDGANDDSDARSWVTEDSHSDHRWAGSEKDSESGEGERKLKSLESDGIVQKYYAELHDSLWGWRGWTYQEQILCARALVFTKTSVFFDCQLSLSDGSGSWPGKDDPFIKVRAGLAQRFHRRWPDFQHYVDLICPYNGRQFTYPQDALLGISGILNAIVPSFPGGFISGIPAVFLDYVLLWQPFGTARRRIDREATTKDTEDTTSNQSSLPSWSWCGWECFVDPWSLLSGLAYTCTLDAQARAGNWRTKRLVNWYVTDSADAPISSCRPVKEAWTLDEYTKMPAKADAELPPGWARTTMAQRESPEVEGEYFHQIDPAATFKHPIPIPHPSDARPPVSAESYLVGTTTTASLHPALLIHASPIVTDGGGKLTAFNHPIFKHQLNFTGPSGDSGYSSYPSVLVLQGALGNFAGLLRLMDRAPMDLSSGLMLVAISIGSASERDLRKTYEWTAFERRLGQWDERSGDDMGMYREEWPGAVKREYFTTSLAEVFQHGTSSSREGGSKQESDSSDGSQWMRKPHEKASLRGAKLPLLNQQEKEKARFNSVRDSDICEFYNVLWVELKGKIMHRRACGWVAKDVWDAHASKPVEVRLG